MKKIAFLLSFFVVAFAGKSPLIEAPSALSVKDTSAKLQEILKSKGLTIFAVVDHHAAAKQAGLDMQEAQVVIFGSPKAGTPLMQCSPEIAVELPLKFLIYQDKNKKTKVAYESLKSVAKRYNTKNCQKIVENLSKAQENFFKALTK